MKKSSKITLAIVALFAAAAVLIGLGGVGVARAAIAATSDVYVSDIEMKSIGITLNENDEVATELLTQLPRDTFTLGTKYDEKLTVTNSSSIDEYVRVVIDLYWENTDGSKNTELEPQLIGLSLTDDGSWVDDLEANGWIVDPESSYVKGTGEQMVLYYKQILPVGETSAEISNFIRVDNSIASAVEQTVNEDGTVTTTYKYDGISFGIDIQADAVQTHNAQDAILSAWGASVNVADDGSLSLK